MDWHTWHDDYDRPGTWMARLVQQRIRDTRDGAQSSPPWSAFSGVHESESTRATRAPGTPSPLWSRYQRAPTILAQHANRCPRRGMVPADLVLACGVFGNITDDDIRRTVGFRTQLCAAQSSGPATAATSPTGVPVIYEWFEERGYERL